MSSWQPPLDLEGLGQSANGTIPSLYLACALSHISAETRRLLEPLIEVVKAAIREATRESLEAWEIALYAPIDHSSPWGRPAIGSVEVYEANHQRLRERTDGLIMFGHDGGSYGGGQEFACAAAMRLPILYITPTSGPEDEATISRQVKGTPVDLTICAYDSMDDLSERVRQWVRTRRAVLEDRARQRQDRPLVHGNLHASVARRFTSLAPDARISVVMESGLHPRRFEALLASITTWATASLEEVVAVTAAMGLSLTAAQEHAPAELTDRQRLALATAASECAWTPDRILGLERLARRELARGGVRRFPLSTPESWIDFDQRYRP